VLAVTRGAAKWRFFKAVGAIAIVIGMVGSGLWIVFKDEAEVESAPAVAITPSAIEVQPTVEAPVGEVKPTVQAPTQTQVVTPKVAKPESKKMPKVAVVTVTSAPVPEAAPEVQKAQVRLILKEGAVASVALSGSGGTFTVSPADASANVPPGEYAATVTMEGHEGASQTGTLMVTPGLTTITCSARFKKCTGLK
jgi:hypothetical protein